MKQIYIHSCPRSGSTWLLSIFDSHPNIKTVYQPLFSYKFKNVLNVNSTKSEYDTFINNLLKTNDDFCCMKSDLHTNNKKIDVIEYEKKEINTLLIKHVTHHNLIETFIKLNPDIKIIGLIRDAKSTIYSQITANRENLVDWLNGEDKNTSDEFYFGFNKWIETKNIFYNLKLKYPNNIIIVNYNDLVNNTNIKIQEICNFCDVQFHNNMLNVIKLMNSKNNEYDYSVFKTEDTINKWKNLSLNIIDYIDNYESKLNLAICTCFNDIEKISIAQRKTTNNSIKSYLTYTEQFEGLYRSIKKNLKSVNYKIYIFNTIPFSQELNDYYKKLGVIVLTRKTDNEYFNRPEIYMEKINCDYKLVLDVDTLIVNDFGINVINYIKKFDCMGTYGHRNINKYFYNEILNALNLSIPKEIELVNNNNDYNWSNIATYSYIFNKTPGLFQKRQFPYFNNGCIIIKNDKSYELGKLWKIKRQELYDKNLIPNLGQSGELTIGLCINHLFDNWFHSPKGFNLVCSCQTNKYINLEFEKFTKPYIIHYISVPYNSKIYDKYMKEYLEDLIN